MSSPENSRKVKKEKKEKKDKKDKKEKKDKKHKKEKYHKPLELQCNSNSSNSNITRTPSVCNTTRVPVISANCEGDNDEEKIIKKFVPVSSSPSATGSSSFKCSTTNYTPIPKNTNSDTYITNITTDASSPSAFSFPHGNSCTTPQTNYLKPPPNHKTALFSAVKPLDLTPYDQSSSNSPENQSNMGQNESKSSLFKKRSDTKNDNNTFNIPKSKTVETVLDDFDEEENNNNELETNNKVVRAPIANSASTQFFDELKIDDELEGDKDEEEDGLTHLTNLKNDETDKFDRSTKLLPTEMTPKTENNKNTQQILKNASTDILQSGISIPSVDQTSLKFEACFEEEIEISEERDSKKVSNRE